MHRFKAPRTLELAKYGKTRRSSRRISRGKLAIRTESCCGVIMVGLSFPKSAGKVSARCTLRAASSAGVCSLLDGNESRACCWSATASWRGDIDPGELWRGAAKDDRCPSSVLPSFPRLFRFLSFFGLVCAKLEV